MGRSTVRADAATRAYLLEDAVEFRRLMCSTLLEDSAESARCASDQLSGRVDELARGESVRIRRYELPSGHPMSAPAAGRPTDELEITADDVVRERVP